VVRLQSLALFVALALGCGVESGPPLGRLQAAVDCREGELPRPAFGEAIEPLTPYEPQTGCSFGDRPGVVAFRELVMAVYPCTSAGRIHAPCEGERSEHKDGRAWDWTVDEDNPVAGEVIEWLLESDGHGNRQARARRLGLMYIIFDEKIWATHRADEGWRPYDGENDHTSHMHFSFSHDGADELTSWWQHDDAGDDHDSDDQGADPPSEVRWIGDPCQRDADCQVAHREGTWRGDCEDGFCTQPCSSTCPDLYERQDQLSLDGRWLVRPMTFCAEADPDRGPRCYTRRDYYFRQSTGCPEGTRARLLPRQGQPGFERNVCLPLALWGGRADDAEAGPGAPPTAAGDEPDLDKGREHGGDGGCAVAPPPPPVLPLFLVATLWLYRRIRRA
jgi:hypothetical protein